MKLMKIVFIVNHHNKDNIQRGGYFMSEKCDVDHTEFLNKLRLDTITGKEFLQGLQLDCFRFIFTDTLNYEQQLTLGDFMGTSDNFNSLTPIDFCVFFLKNRIKFTLAFQYCDKRTKEQNEAAERAINAINDRLNSIT